MQKWTADKSQQSGQRNAEALTAIQKLRNHSNPICQLQDYPNLLKDARLAEAFQNNNSITALHIKTPLSEGEMVRLCDLVESNPRLVKVALYNKTLPLKAKTNTTKESSISASLEQNALMANPQNKQLFDPAQQNVVIENPRILLFDSYFAELASHQNITTIILTNYLTHYYQITRLARILAINTRILKISLHKFAEFGWEHEEESKSQLFGTRGSDDTLQSTVARLFSSLKFNASLVEVNQGRTNCLKVPPNISSEQISALISCLQSPYKIEKLELSEIQPEIFQRVLPNCTITQLHFSCDIERKEYKPIAELLENNLSIQEVSHGTQPSYVEKLSNQDSTYNAGIPNQLKVNKFLHSFEEGGTTQRILAEDLTFNPFKSNIFVRKLETCRAVRHIHFQKLTMPEPELFEIFCALERSGCSSLRSLIISDMQLSPRVIKKIIDIVSNHPNFTILQLISVGFGDSDIPLLTQWLKNNPPLTVLNLHGNLIGNDGINSLCQTLETNKRVSSLYLGGNRFDTTALPAITRLLSQNSYIARLNLQSSCLLENDVKSFIDTLKKSNYSIVDLKISHHTYKNTYKVGGYNGQQVVTAYKKQFTDMIDKFVARNAEERAKLFTHVRRNEIPQVRKMFANRVSPLCTDDNGDTSLHVALVQQPFSFELVECLIKCGCHPLLVNKAGIASIDLLPADSSAELVQLFQNPQFYFSSKTPTKGGESDLKKIKKEAAPPKGNMRMDQFLAPQNSQSKAAPKRTLDSNDEAGEQALEKPGEIKQAKITPNTIETSLYNQSQAIKTAYFATLNNQSGLLGQCIKDMDPLHRYQDGNSLWHIAVTHSAYDCLHVVYRHKESAKITNLFLQLPLHLACLHIDIAGSIELVDFVLSANPQAANAVDAFDQTPLFCLTGGFKDSNYNPHADRIRAEAAVILLSHGANPNHIVDDLNNQRAQCSILQKAISRGLYKLGKVIMTSPQCNLAHVDSAGWSALHYAVFFGQIEILARLLIQPNVDFNSTNIEGRTPRQMARDHQFAPGQKNSASLKGQIEALFEARSQQRLFSLASDVHWVKNLTIRFGCRFGRNQELVQSFNEEHALLQNEVRAQMKSEGNYLSASLTFIVSKGEHQPGSDLPRVAVKVNMTFTPKYHPTHAWQSEEIIEKPNSTSTFKKFKRSPDARDRILARFDAAPEDIKSTAVDNVNNAGRPLSKEGIEKLFRSEDSSADEYDFEKHFHHSEPALFDHLQQPHIIKHILDALHANIQFSRGCKIYAVVLNAFSKNYLCPDCMVATMGFQNTKQGEFFKSLKTELRDIGCVFPLKSPLRSITLFSAQQNYKQPRKSADEHENTVIDIRAYPNNQILSQDATAIQPTSTVYTSRK
ncbi:MAG: hypothetical protein K2X50_02640 [Gammaproteobacteria bacterium]|nr:hypothetical protein [Gammaproteobacteria bacterium]